MTDELLPASEAAPLRSAPLTYPEVGLTLGDLPLGYHHINRSAVVGAGRARFTEVGATLLRWQMHRGAGVSVRASSDPLVESTVAVLRLGRGPLGVDAPVRVVYLLDEERRTGFAYGTLPGHPERGEEAFLVELRDDDQVVFTIRAFSRPASPLARLGGPFSRSIQRWVTNRYLHAV